jgi:hypothetical protein
MITLADWGDGIFRDQLGNRFRYCSNGEVHGVCNWLRPADDPHPLCTACRFNRTVPNQARPGNQRRWLVLERAKKRLFYTLMQLNLPLISGWDDPQPRPVTGLHRGFALLRYVSGDLRQHGLPRRRDHDQRAGGRRRGARRGARRAGGELPHGARSPAP